MGDWQVPLAWARPLPVFCGEWVRGRPCPSALPDHLEYQQPQAWAHLSRGVDTVHPEPPACTPRTCASRSGSGHTCVQMGGHIQVGEAGGQLCALLVRACCPCQAREAPAPVKHRYSWTWVPGPTSSGRGWLSGQVPRRPPPSWVTLGRHSSSCASLASGAKDLPGAMGEPVP